MKKTKPTLILLPGYDGNGKKSFVKLGKLLKDRFEVISLDFPFLNKTDKRFTLDELTEFVHSSVGKQSDSVHLAGFSMGGWVALKYAESHPDRLHSLTLISSAANPAIHGSSRLLVALTSPISRSRRFANWFAAIYCSPRLRKWMSKLPVPPLRAGFTADRGYAVFGTLAQVVRDMEKHGIDWSLPASIKKKAILFADDLSFPGELYKNHLERLGFAVTINPRGGHAVSEDYWDQVARDF